MELFCIGVLAGVVFAIIVFTSGVLYGDFTREHSGNSDDIIHFSCRDRVRSGAKRKDKSMDAEDVIVALQNIRRVSRTERDALDYAAECVLIRQKLEKWLEERGENGLKERDSKG